MTTMVHRNLATKTFCRPSATECIHSHLYVGQFTFSGRSVTINLSTPCYIHAAVRFRAVSRNRIYLNSSIPLKKACELNLGRDKFKCIINVSLNTRVGNAFESTGVLFTSADC